MARLRVSSSTVGMPVPAPQAARASRMRRELAGGSALSEAVTHHVGAGAGPAERAAHWRSLHAGQLGLTAELWELLQAPGVTDVLINGTDVWVDRGDGCEPVGYRLPDGEAARRLAVQMAGAAGKRLDDASPLVDGFLGDFVRLHAVLPPLSREGPLISLRVLPREGFSLEELVSKNTVPDFLYEPLRRLVKNRVSVLVSGATGSGKTTLLGALLAAVPKDQRIVCVEEVSELFPNHPHVVHLQERQPNVEGSGTVSLADLVRASLRMRPDRIVLGECRGPEVREVLLAMNTGHTGGFTTLHANGVNEVPPRLIALGSLAGMDAASVETHAAAAFQVLLHLGRDQGGQRRLEEVGVMLPELPLRAGVAWQLRAGEYVSGPAEQLFDEISAGDAGGG